MKVSLPPFALSLSKGVLPPVAGDGLRQAQPERKAGLARTLQALALVVTALPLGACGLHPLYAGGGSGPVASALAGVAVDPIEGRNGYLVSNALRDRLVASGTPRFRLAVKLDNQIQGLDVRTDNSVSRERVTLRARYQLIEAETNTVVLDATAGSDEGIDAVGSEYATIAAENTAVERLAGIVADQIVARVALYARRTSAAPATP